MSEDNHFKESCLLSISSSEWRAKKKLANELLEKIGPPEMLSGSAKTTAENGEKLITEPRRIVAQCRKEIKKLSAPFPIKGVNIILNHNVARADAILQMFSGLFYSAVDSIVMNYQDIKEEAYNILSPKGLYDPSDYPVNIRNKYDFEWNYFTMEPPERLRSIGADILERAQRKLLQSMQIAESQCQDLLLGELSKLVDHMVDRLGYSEDGKPKVFKASPLIDNFTEFFEGLKDRNVFASDAVMQMADKARSIMHGVTAEKLKNNVSVRDEIRAKMEGFKAVLDMQIQTAPSRNIILPNKEAA